MVAVLLAMVLERDYGFMKVCLSDYVRKEWAKINGKTEDEAKKAPRDQLQTVGNSLRYNNGNFDVSILAKMAYSDLEPQQKTGKFEFVFDSIRNMGEVEYFRTNVPDFYLISLDCVETDRWIRSQKSYQGNYDLFRENDKRYKNEEGLPYGQQVALCVDDADVIIRNDTRLIAQK